MGKVIDGMYVTNGTYAYLSMLNGDAYAKKFGGVSGNDPDWFKLTIRKWYNGILANDSVTFYLADYIDLQIIRKTISLKTGIGLI